jgi:hypothetical protein
MGYGDGGGPPYAQFVDQIEIQSSESSLFSDHGDSGSLVFESSSLGIVGLLFSGGTGTSGAQVTWANPFSAVKEALGIYTVYTKEPGK